MADRMEELKAADGRLGNSKTDLREAEQLKRTTDQRLAEAVAELSDTERKIRETDRDLVDGEDFAVLAQRRIVAQAKILSLQSKAAATEELRLTAKEKALFANTAVTEASRAYAGDWASRLNVEMLVDCAAFIKTMQAKHQMLEQILGTLQREGGPIWDCRDCIPFGMHPRFRELDLCKTVAGVMEAAKDGVPPRPGVVIGVGT